MTRLHAAFPNRGKRTARRDTDRKIAVIIVAVWIAAVLFGLFVYKSQGLLIDYAILNAVHVKEYPVLTRLMKGLTVTGDPLFYVILNLTAAVWLLKKRKYPELICLLAAVLFAWGMNEAMKHLFMRIRPDGYALIEQGGFSYPSGHSMVAAAWYPVAGYLLQYGRDDRAAAGWILFAFGFLPGISRLFLGVHYPTDIFFGHLLGLTIAYLCMRFYADRRRKKGRM